MGISVLAINANCHNNIGRFFNASDFTKKTVDCYFKGRPTTRLFTWILMIGYALLSGVMFSTVIVDLIMWQKAAQILVYFPFDIIHGSRVSDLDVIMTRES